MCNDQSALIKSSDWKINMINYVIYSSCGLLLLLHQQANKQKKRIEFLTAFSFCLQSSDNLS